MSLTSELLNASSTGDLKGAQKLLAQGVDPNCKSWRADSPLHLAVFEGYYELACLLLEKGADANAKGEGEETALHLAAYQGDLPMVKILLSKGAIPNAQNKNGWTPIQCALREAKQEVFKYLLPKTALGHLKTLKNDLLFGPLVRKEIRTRTRDSVARKIFNSCLELPS